MAREKQSGLSSRPVVLCRSGRIGLSIGSVALVAFACSRKSAPEPPAPSASSVPSIAPAATASLAPAHSASALPDASASPSPSATPPAESPAAPPDSKQYAWLATDAGRALKIDGTVESRFKPPPGYTRLSVEPGSFAAWLRSLPLTPTDTAVTRFDGSVSRAGDDEYVAGVLAVDVGGSDLQQSADALIRLHAEWLWANGAKDEISYPGGPKLTMPLARWEKGQRVVSEGANVYWALQAKPATAEYADFRQFLDNVFTWANSASLARRAVRVEASALVPGDFFLQTKPPAHVAIVLDVATKPNGDRVALLAQALSPAESLHVLRPGRATAWFSLRPERDVLTPHSAPFAWDDLRRLPPLKKAAEDSGG